MNSLLQFTLPLFSLRFVSYKNNTTNTSSSIHSNGSHLASLSIFFMLLSSFEMSKDIYQILYFVRIGIVLSISGSFVTFSHLYQNDKILSIFHVIFNKACVSLEIWRNLIRFIVALFYVMYSSHVITLLLAPFYENNWNNNIETTCLLCLLDAFGCITLSIYDDLDNYNNQEYNIFCESCQCTEIRFWISRWSFGWTDVCLVVLFVHSILLYERCCTNINKNISKCNIIIANWICIVSTGVATRSTFSAMVGEFELGANDTDIEEDIAIKHQACENLSLITCELSCSD